MAARLPDSVWAAIKTVWEFDPDTPSYGVAAERAGEKHGFTPPGKTAVQKHAVADAKAGDGWERRGSLAGINKSAHRKADKMVDSDGSRKGGDGGVAGVADGAVDSTKKEQAARQDSENVRAEVLVRHRAEWKQVVALRQEALQVRTTEPDRAFTKAKLAKITAEMTMIQQNGERKAWGLDELGDFDPTKLSDEELDAVIRGR